ncbi:regulatory protein RecX [Reichenbachiella versicolor]|uniref:regulatory protein RecX n=1 Tax=Reichenbachiella versicolor TaxID=1821036 RepID=UPI000D6EA7B7|nr:RecX family transcriptional regulator [Reichenbachiella versicolor]
MEERLDKKRLTPKQAKLKAANYCAYQERSQKEVKKKLYDLGLWKDEVDEVLTDLIIEGFINEERFAKSYVGGKFRVKKWGRNRILMGLKEHHISKYCIKKGMEEIDDSEYKSTLAILIEKKAFTEKETNVFKRREKISRSMIYKGYESSLVWEFVNDLVN